MNLVPDYHRPWAALFRLNWQNIGPRGTPRLVPRPGRVESPELTQLESAAEQIAARHHRAPIEEDYRHAATVVCLKCELSSKKFSATQLAEMKKFLLRNGEPATINPALYESAEETRRRKLVAIIRDCCVRGYVTTGALIVTRQRTSAFENLTPAETWSLFCWLKNEHRNKAWKDGGAYNRRQRAKLRAQKNGGARLRRAVTPPHSPLRIPHSALPPEWPDELPSAHEANPY